MLATSNILIKEGSPDERNILLAAVSSLDSNDVLGMRKFFREVFGFKMARHRQHRELIHNAGAALRHVHKGHAMLVLGGLALAAEIFRRRRHSSERVPQLTGP